MKKKVWFVTGASRGLGLALVKQLLSNGYLVAASSRNVNDLIKSVDADKQSFLPLTIDIIDEKSVEKGIQAAVDHFGKIDIVVNNAGYGLAGALEELSDDETRKNFDVNVFGSLNVIRKVLPHLRRQMSGHIFNLSSIGGFIGLFPGFGIYCATKFAVQGFSESLSTEVKPFGIKVTIVSPGYFRTNFLSDSSLNVPKNQLDEYKNVREVQADHQNNYNGQQNGDPQKAVSVMIQVAEMKEPPLHLFLGQDAYNLANEKISVIQNDMNKLKALATSTGFDE